MANFLWLGISLAVFASMCGTIGKQRLRLSKLLGDQGDVKDSKVANFVGWTLNAVVGPIVDMLSYTFAPQSLIAPLGGLDVVWNTILAPVTLGEKLSPLKMLGAFIIAAGATSTSLFGNHDDKDYTLEIVQDTFISRRILIYLGVLILWLLFNILVLQPRSASPKGEPWEPGDPVRGLSLALTAGTLSGNMFCVKGFMELVQASFRDEDGGEVWAHWLPYALLLGAVFFAISNVVFLGKAMKQYEALFMGAVFEGALIVCACISGIVVWKDLENMEWYSILLYFLALLAIVVGIGVVTAGCWVTDQATKDESGAVAVQLSEESEDIGEKAKGESSAEVRARSDSNISRSNSFIRRQTSSPRTDAARSPFPGLATTFVNFDQVGTVLLSPARARSSSNHSNHVAPKKASSAAIGKIEETDTAYKT